ncbi:MAG TPA: PRC-barrel domain-containing protein [Candidatus Thermoplasmatota archaeon]|nr:PRC-barrel domain-containing protein [Candidatus Thermoplasmatota archaeon]
MTDWTIEELRGRKVIDRHGDSLGQVRDVLIDDAQWSIEGIVVDVNRDVAEELNLKTPLFGGTSLTLDKAHVDTVGDNVILSVSRTDLASKMGAPETTSAGGPSTGPGGPAP